MALILYSTAFTAAALVFLILDGLWLGVVAKDFYFTRLQHLMADNINFVGAAAFYLVYIAGIVYFAVKPGLEVNSWKQSLLNGLLFGFFAYATYNLTNWATLKNWPVTVSIADMAWGTVLTGLCSVAGMLAAQALRTFMPSGPPSSF